MIEFSDRLKYGLEGELAVKEYLESKGLNIYHNQIESEPGEPNFFNEVRYNTVHGDLFIMSNRAESSQKHQTSIFRIDVKRGSFIAKKSLDMYKGQFYFLIPGGDITQIENTRVIWRRTVVNHVHNVTNSWRQSYEEIRPGEIGFRLSKPLRLEMSLKEFTNRFIKRIIAHPGDLNRPTSDFNKAFFIQPED